MPNDFAAPSAFREHCVGDYVLRNTIGKGACAKVRLARHVLTGAEVVVKAISRQGFSRFYQEVYCLQSLCHPNITKLLEVIATRDKFYLVMEHVTGGDLLEHLENHGRLTEGEARGMFRQVVSALQYCHRRGIAHRDVKPDNILVDGDMTVKLADFGFSREVGEEKLSTFCGTIYYMAPEIMQHELYDGRKADVWSLGVALYRTVTGQVPFAGESFGKLRDQVLAGRFVVPPFLTRQGKHFLKKLLTVDPHLRPTLEEVMQDPWLNMGQEEQLRPYCELPGADLDPQVMRTMQDLGFQQDQIRQSLTQRKFDRVMGTYQILRLVKTKMPGRTIRVRPCPSLDTIRVSSSHQAVQPLDEKSEEPSIPPRHHLWVKVTIPPPSLETMSTTPPLDSIELRSATPIPDLRFGHRGLPTIYSCSSIRSSSRRSSSSDNISISISRGGAPEGAAVESCLRAGKPDVGTPASSANSQGRMGLARRAFRIFLKLTCCGLPNKHLKRTRVKPI